MCLLPCVVRAWPGLQKLARVGFRPDWVIDAGANKGAFTESVSRQWPGVPVLMIEANLVHKAHLGVVARRVEALCLALSVPLDCHNAFLVMGLLGDRDGQEVEFHRVEGAATGASVFKEHSNQNWTTLKLQTQTLDTMARPLLNSMATRRGLLKLDVQGAEMLVLAGATRVLSRTDVILMEVSVMQYNRGAPLLAEMVLQLRSLGFIAWKMTEDHVVRSGHTIQMDFIFARPTSLLFDPRLTGYPRPEYIATDSRIQKHVLHALIVLLSEYAKVDDPDRMQRALQQLVVSWKTRTDHAV